MQNSFRNKYLNLFKGVITDNTSGSGWLLSKIIEIIDRNAVNNNFLEENFTQISKQLKTDFSSFPMILHYLDVLNKEHKKGKKLAITSENYQKHWQNYTSELIKNAISALAFNIDNVLVHSNSSMVFKLIVELKKQKNFGVLQTESRPMNEGRNQAIKFLENGIRVDFFVDAMSNLNMEKADIVILGADILTDSFFVNKIGSFAICLLAKYHKVPVLLVADTRKKIQYSGIAASEFDKIYPENEVWNEKDPNLTIHNQYFEKIPLDYVDIRIT